jgi:transposase
MAKVGKRNFNPQFRCEAVALWETSGRRQAEIAGELEIIPMMLRRG